MQIFNSLRRLWKLFYFYDYKNSKKGHKSNISKALAKLENFITLKTSANLNLWELQTVQNFKASQTSKNKTLP